MPDYLTDLDVLALRCRSAAGRAGIEEAIACYRAGAFRSCIVSTWNAVVWDYIDKLRALAATGHADAKTDYQKWEAACESFDKTSLQHVESEVIPKMQCPYEFVSKVEIQDLQRLNEDRNRCAHPAFSRPEEIYQPSAELARAHLFNAVNHFIQHPPVQGKVALKSLLEEVISPYFPNTVEDAERQLRLGPIMHARESLVRNFTVVLMKSLLVQVQDEANCVKWRAALGAVLKIHRERVVSIWASDLPHILRLVPDAGLVRGIQFVAAFPESWDFWSQDQQERWGRFIVNAPEEDRQVIISLTLQCPPLRNFGIQFINTLDDEVIRELVIFHGKYAEPPIEVIHRALDLWKNATSFDEANRLARKVLPYCVYRFDKRMLDEILRAAATNKQIKNSTSLDAFLCLVRPTNCDDVAPFDALARNLGFNELVDTWEGKKCNPKEVSVSLSEDG